jgi:hypothetical protein
VALLVAGVSAAVATAGSPARHASVAHRTRTTAATTTLPPTSPPPTTAATTTTAASTTTTTTPPAAPAQLQLAGCPVPPNTPVPPTTPPWHPATLVPDSSLPPVTAPPPWRSNLSAIQGKGMWIWEWSQTDGGNPQAIVAQARQAGLHQLWVRVGDSKNGFYGAAELNALVPAAHAAGLAVIAWGFPYLYDPQGDARWSQQVLAWRDPAGQGVDGFSADLEERTEGVDMTPQRAAVYLELVRRYAGNRLIVATVYPPTRNGYPYGAMSPYVDAFAPMIYWECTNPVADASFDISRLATMRPVHVIGQAFNLAGEGGRANSPSAAEITAFMSASKAAGAVGASFWVWQSATPPEWSALSAFAWNA